jgi:hypothetical protein
MEIDALTILRWCGVAGEKPGLDRWHLNPV